MLDNDFSFSSSDGSKEGTLVLRLSGPFTLGNIFDLQNQLRTLKPTCLIMDLTGVPYMDSAGLGVIMNYYVSSEAAKRKFFLTGVNDRIHALLEATKVDEILNVQRSIEAAESIN